MTNSADPDQLASSDLDLHCLQRQGIFRFSRTRVKQKLTLNSIYIIFRCVFHGKLIEIIVYEAM